MQDTSKLLIVEDERIVAMDLSRRLQNLNHEVVGIVSNGPDAFKAVEEYKPDLVLMDIQIQGDMDGIEAAAILREKYNIPHMFLTAYRDEKTVNRAKRTDPDGYILKPFNDRDIQLNLDIALYKGKMRNELRLSELKFRTLIHNSSDIITVINTNGTIDFASPSVYLILGYNPEQLKGKMVSEYIHPDNMSSLSTILKRINVYNGSPETKSVLGEHNFSNDPIFKEEVRFKHAEKGWVYLEVIGSIIEIPELPKAIVLNARDITDRKRIEQELIQAKMKAEEMNRLKSTFLSNVSHEIRTPLTGVLGFASILESELEGDHLFMAESISKSGQRLLQTMESVIDLAMIESNKIEVVFEPVVISEQVQQAIRMLTGLAYEKNLRMKLVARNEPESFMTDPRLLGQILNNLVANAIKFTESGSVTITIDQQFIQSNNGNGRRSCVAIQVKDTGVGIKPEFIPYIFDEFKQESSGNTRKYEGTGIGLSIAKRMAGLLNGDIEVESVPEKGSIFTIKLPIEL
jgi:PAS domain S-box-containing protein